MVVSGNPLNEFAGEITDNVVAILRDLIIEKCDFDPSIRHLEDAIHSIGLEFTFHPIKDYLQRLTWDKTPRVETMLIEYFGVEDTEYNRAVSTMMMVAAIRRIKQPGVKFDTIIVLEGGQGSGKSTALCILAGEENFVDSCILGADSKVVIELIEGAWIYDLGVVEIT